MSKLTKIFGFIGAFFLIGFDVFAIYRCFGLGLTNAMLFNQILYNMLPCGLILGLLTIFVLLNKSAKKIFNIFAIVFFGIATLTRIFATAMYILYFAKSIDFSTVTVVFYLDFIEFIAYIPLCISVIFLAIYLMKGKFLKTTQILGGISFITLLITRIIYIVHFLNLEMFNGLSFFAVVSELFAYNLFWNIFIVAAYALVFGSLTGVMEKKE